MSWNFASASDTVVATEQDEWLKTCEICYPRGSGALRWIAAVLLWQLEGLPERSTCVAGWLDAAEVERRMSWTVPGAASLH